MKGRPSDGNFELFDDSQLLSKGEPGENLLYRHGRPSPVRADDAGRWTDGCGDVSLGDTCGAVSECLECFYPDSRTVRLFHARWNLTCLTLEPL